MNLVKERLISMAYLILAAFALFSIFYLPNPSLKTQSWNLPSYVTTQTIKPDIVSK